MTRAAAVVLTVVFAFTLAWPAASSALADQEARGGQGVEFSFGDRLTNFLQTSDAQVESSVDDGLFEVSYKRSNESQRLTKLERRTNEHAVRLNELESRTERLTNDAGSRHRGQYHAELARLRAELLALDRSLERTAGWIRETGGNTDRIERLRSSTAELLRTVRRAFDRTLGRSETPANGTPRGPPDDPSNDAPRDLPANPGQPQVSLDGRPSSGASDRNDSDPGNSSAGPGNGDDDDEGNSGAPGASPGNGDDDDEGNSGAPGAGPGNGDDDDEGNSGAPGAGPGSGDDDDDDDGDDGGAPGASPGNGVGPPGNGNGVGPGSGQGPPEHAGL